MTGFHSPWGMWTSSLNGPGSATKGRMIMVAKFISSGDIGTGPAETAPGRPGARRVTLTHLWHPPGHNRPGGCRASCPRSRLTGRLNHIQAASCPYRVTR